MKIYRTHLAIYVDWPWSEDVREYSCPVRVNLHTKHWLAMVGAKSQRWHPRLGNTSKWARISWHPKQGCHAPLGAGIRCPLRLNHQGDHYNWEQKRYQTRAYFENDPRLPNLTER